MDADFDWGDVQASVPIHPKADYELTIKNVRGSAWPKKDLGGNPTGDIVKVVKLRPEVVGVYDSKGKLKSEGADGKNIAGATAEEINLWIHSDGGRRQAKKAMMSVLGYNPEDEAEEKKFNKFIKDNSLDLGHKVEENEAGDGYVMTLGEGWKMLVGKNVRAHMEPETRTVEGRDPVTSQNYVRLSPVNPA
jgi:hypothetical protein